MKLAASRLTTYLTGKILTYYFNAYADAKISQELITYIKSGGKRFATSDTVTQKRAADYLAAQKEPHPDFAIGLAYTAYMGNGLGNILYSWMLEHLLPKKNKLELTEFLQKYMAKYAQELHLAEPFAEFATRKWFRLWYYPLVALRPLTWIKSFAASHCNCTAAISRKECLKACLTVQQQNIQNNRQTAARLIKKDIESDIKVKLLHEAAEHFEHPEVFIKACANSQKAAARWDRVWVWFLQQKI